MKQLIRFVSYTMVFVFLLIQLAPSVNAISHEECQHDIGVGSVQNTSEYGFEESKDAGQTRNALCSLFGHKLTYSTITLLKATMIDSEQCELYYDESGYCDRCSEFVRYLRTEVRNHNIKISGNRTYCTYGCGYDMISLK